MNKIICECGHENPVGTSLCAICGRPLTVEEKEKKLADMRYDGIAIRSKTHKKSMIDKVWNFFSSVKVGVTLIIINLVFAAVGTILPQEFYVTDTEKAAYYERVYGTFGKFYYELGLSDIYSAWWFQILVGLLATSIIIASIDRGIPLHKNLKKQRVKRHESFMRRQRLVASGMPSNQQNETLSLAEEKLKEMRYNVRVEGQSLLAERGRFARYGPYINHLGLILFLLGVMLKLVPGMYVYEQIWLREGETRAVKGMDGYVLENKDFILEVHENTNQVDEAQGVNVVAKNFQTDIALYKLKDGAVTGEEADMDFVKDYSIRVNDPLKYDGYAVYQMDFRLNELKAMHFQLINKETEEKLGAVTIDLANPQQVYELGNDTRVELLSYYADFSGFKDGEPQNASPYPNNPAFIFNMYTPVTPEGERSFVAIQQTLEPGGENLFKMAFESAETRDISGLTVTKDRTIPLLIVGGFIFMLGVVIGSYWNHRRVWLEQKPDGSILMAAHVNKNWFSMKKDMDALTQFAHLPPYIDQVEDAITRELKEMEAEDEV